MCYSLQRNRLKTPNFEQFCGFISLKAYNLAYNITMSKKEWVEAQIKGNKVVVFSKTYCPHCKTVKQAFSDVGLKEYLVIELDTRDDGGEIQDVLLGITGARTVPRVFIGGESIGGSSDTMDLQSSGKLVPKLKSAGVL